MNSVVMLLNAQEPEFLSYSEIREETQEFDSSNFYSFMQPKMRQIDVFSFNKLYIDSFNQELMNNEFLNYPVEVSGAFSEARKEAAEDILEYMMSNGILKSGEIDSIYLDKHLPKNVLGRTEFDEYSDNVTVAYRPEIFNKSYKDVRDPVISQAIKYIQARTLKHERVHEEMLGSPDAYRAVRNLGEMNYSEDVFNGLLEGIAEIETLQSFKDAGEYGFAEKVQNESPYKEQLRIVERIENEFNYSDGERIYRGARGFYEALAKGLLDKETTDDLLGGIELKSDFMPAYGHLSVCGSLKEYA
ncbi:MAG: hypothetical protein ABIF85_01205 [Nanoarchaeota archaeon]|nr:hypothetical protein [Nanoarchaeota archaeon]MBU4299816.1 hypothetical protein [Nanoarchaeota archaeon]MBU4451285.1 hypothetical protein [Nanoarchaeota archaeon]MCG2723574.1 hypothetical protein [archaeon]